MVSYFVRESLVCNKFVCLFIYFLFFVMCFYGEILSLFLWSISLLELVLGDFPIQAHMGFYFYFQRFKIPNRRPCACIKNKNKGKNTHFPNRSPGAYLLSAESGNLSTIIQKLQRSMDDLAVYANQWRI